MESLPFGRDGTWSEARVGRLNPLQLAYVGDAVYHLYVRTRLLHESDERVHALSLRANGQVCAHAQALALDAAMDMLTEEERLIVRRGRNAHAKSIPRNADRKDYQRATALEALIGYLYLSGRDDRVEEIMQRITADKRNGEIE